MIEWRSIPSFPQYEASYDGRIRRLRWELTPRCNGHGYMRVTLCTNNRPVTRYVHRLVCEAFHGPCPPGYECRHLDGTRANNVAGNLQWVTKKVNEADKLKHGTLVKGSAVKGAVLNEELVCQARLAAARGDDILAIAEKAGVSWVNLREAVCGRRWRHLSVKPVAAPRKGGALTSDDVARIKSLLATGDLLQREIGEMFGVNQTHISQIRRGLIWSHVANDIVVPAVSKSQAAKNWWAQRKAAAKAVGGK